MSVHHEGRLRHLARRALPGRLRAPIAMIQNWTYSLFYLLANMWGSVVVSLLFWGFANEVTTVDEATKYYPFFGLFANVALVFSGQFIRYVSSAAQDASGGSRPVGRGAQAAHVERCVSGGVIAACFRYLNVAVLGAARLKAPDRLERRGRGGLAPKKKKKPSMGFASRTVASASPYIRNLATLVIAYGMAINLVEVTWKGKLKQRSRRRPNDYSAFMGGFSAARASSRSS